MILTIKSLIEPMLRAGVAAAAGCAGAEGLGGRKVCAEAAAGMSSAASANESAILLIHRSLALGDTSLGDTAGRLR